MQKNERAYWQQNHAGKGGAHMKQFLRRLNVSLCLSLFFFFSLSLSVVLTTATVAVTYIIYYNRSPSRILCKNTTSVIDCIIQRLVIHT